MESKKNIFRYFKTLFEVFIVVILISVFLYLLCLTRESLKKYAVIFAIGLVALFILLNLRQICFFLSVSHEYRRRCFQQKEIIVYAIECDHAYNYYNRSGVIEGKEKAILIDTKGEKYHFMGDSGASFILKGKKLQVTYLPKTRFLISVIPNYENEDKDIIKFIKEYFEKY